MKINHLAVITILLALNACVIFKQPEQDIKINIVGAKNAVCTVSNESSLVKLTAPGTAKIEGSKSDLEVYCSSPGKGKGSAIIKSKRYKYPSVVTIRLGYSQVQTEGEDAPSEDDYRPINTLRDGPISK